LASNEFGDVPSLNPCFKVPLLLFKKLAKSACIRLSKRGKGLLLSLKRKGEEGCKKDIANG
jgi:hypothetical protein